MDEIIVGSVERIIYKNNDNSYHVLSVLLKDKGKQCTITTNHLKLCENLSYEFSGKWIANSKFGNQFQASKVVEIPPSTEDAMVKYLSSSFFKGVGPVLASKIVKHFGDKTYEILKTDIDKLSEVKGLSKKKLEAIKISWAANTEINDIMLFLQSYEISTLLASKIYEFYKSDCISKIKENPYNLERDIENVGFKSCDKIALSMGFKKDCKERISSGIRHTLNEGENNEGHCFLYHKQILDKTTELLGVAIKEKIDEILFELIDNNEIKLSKINEEERFYSNKIYYDERFVANKIDISKNTPGLIHNERIIEEWEEKLGEDGIELSDEQKEAVLGIINEKISVLTGGAGSGKTTCLRQLTKLLELLKVDFAICCPTGKAAMRATEVTGFQVSTIHKLLEWNRFEGTFAHNERNQLSSFQFFIIDESSMINIQLMSSLFKAIPNDCHILLCGDYHQLSPIGAGSPFKDLIIGECVKVFKLNKIFRQVNGVESDIIKSANDIRIGVEPLIESPFEDPSLWTTNKKDCLFIDSGDFDVSKNFNDYPKWHSLNYGFDILEMLKKLYLEIIPKYYPGKKIQIISPLNKGRCGNNYINSIIREIVNPPSKEKNEIDLKSRVLRVNDLVMNTINNYEIGITNGEMGVIKAINPEEKTAVIEFEYENKTVELKRGELLHIVHSYSVSCHKFQGSESPIVISPLSMAHYPLLYRSMLYTLITRGKNLIVLVGERKCLKIATDNVRDNSRQTSLIELIKMKDNVI